MKKVKHYSRFGSLTLLAVLVFGLLSETVMAGKPTNIFIDLNNEYVDTDVKPYNDQGTILVPLNVIQKIPGITVTWDNTTKTVTVARDDEVIKLTADQKHATIGSKKVPLPVPSKLKNGRIMVPIRFIAEAADAYVEWDPYNYIVYVAKPSKELIEKTKSSNLAEARTATLQLPKVRSLKSVTGTVEMRDTINYYFPEGKANQVFISLDDGIEYYEVVGVHLEEKWEVRFGKKDPNGPDFWKHKIEEQSGKMPTITTDRLTFFSRNYMTDMASYGFINKNGARDVSGEQRMPDDEFFQIPGEKH